LIDLRVLSYNVRSLRDDADAVARVIRACEPDVVCLQEAPRFLRWRSRCAALARQSGLVVVGGGRASGANMILSSMAIDLDAITEIGFSQDPGLHHRGAVIARLRRGTVRFAVAGTHLDLAEAPRLRHVHELQGAIEGFVPVGVPLVLAADVNAEPGSPTWDLLVRHRTDVAAGADSVEGQRRTPTFSATDPRRTIDGIFVDPAVTVVSYSVIESADVLVASDHRPLLATLRIDGVATA
jgi:endonuclease/exonuclease/phosphatase family metal-dependent hydrolase